MQHGLTQQSHHMMGVYMCRISPATVELFSDEMRRFNVGEDCPGMYALYALGVGDDSSTQSHRICIIIT
jgi:hypothetical protein